MIKTVDFVHALLEKFHKCIPAYPNGRTHLRCWTKCVYETCRDLEKEKDYEVYCSDGKRGFGEYLLDIVFFNKCSYLADLAIECEWGDCSAIAYDFEKLLWIKSPLKLMICDPQDRRGDPLPVVHQKLRRYTEHQAGEEYVVINVGGHPTGGNTRVFSWRVPFSGKHEGATLMEIPESPFSYSLKPETGYFNAPGVC